MNKEEMILIKKVINLFDLEHKDDLEFTFIKSFKSNNEYVLRIREFGGDKNIKYIDTERTFNDLGKAIRALYKYYLYFKK